MKGILALILAATLLAFPSVLLAGPNVAVLEGIVGYLSRSIQELKLLAAGARAASGVAKEEALVKGRNELAQLQPVFRNAQREAERLKQQEVVVEKWHERIDRVSDLLDAYQKIDELKQLETERDLLKDEFCGPRDLYRFDGGGECRD